MRHRCFARWYNNHGGGIVSGFNGAKIKKLRELKNWSQGELAERAGISRSYLSELENGTRNDPAASFLKKLADTLMVPIDIFFEESNLFPLESIAQYFPEHIKEFLRNQEGIPYLELAVKAKDFQVTPEELAQLIDILGRKAAAAKK